MKSSTRVALAGGLSGVVSFCSTFSAYATGIYTEGGTWENIQIIAIVPLVLNALGISLGALMLLLAEPPKGNKLVTVIDEVKPSTEITFSRNQ